MTFSVEQVEVVRLSYLQAKFGGRLGYRTRRVRVNAPNVDGKLVVYEQPRVVIRSNLSPEIVGTRKEERCAKCTRVEVRAKTKLGRVFIVEVQTCVIQGNQHVGLSSSVPL